ncbi:hypothetical protein QUF79_00660 [Fictibacillus enclensis]|nr:hypothetical protein [Fictibacillus enclensis]MDM5196607.1 hypothetical protein [Fictibacillus enclensis]
MSEELKSRHNAIGEYITLAELLKRKFCAFLAHCPTGTLGHI